MQAGAPSQAVNAEVSRKMYTSPSFNLDRSALDSLLVEASAMSNFLENHNAVRPTIHLCVCV